MSAIELITISREFGAGGAQLAHALGERLGWRVLDQEIVRQVGTRLKIAPEVISARDEHAPHLLERIGISMLLSSPELIPSVEAVQLPTPDEIVDATRDVIRAEVARLPLIVLGHGSQALFADRPNTLRLRLVAPLRDRVRRICLRLNCEEAEAIALAQRMDAERSYYLGHYYQRELSDPLFYHFTINTSVVTLAESLRVLTAFVEWRRAPNEGVPS